jgi:transposase InsO family protein
VVDKRNEMPLIGGRKLLYLLEKDGIHVGRDKLFDILRHENLLVKKRKRKVFTTQSKHWLTKYANLIEGLVVTRANKLWVADITYIITDNGFAYLFLITDAYSRKIVGYHLSQTLEADGGIEALKMALSQVSWQERMGLIHHSDRGVQYCSYNYVNLLHASKMQISMTQNALAERVNGILKMEWIHSEQYHDFQQACSRIAEIIRIYNSSRPHLSCGMLTPEEAHNSQGPLKKHWKKYKSKFYESVNK